MNHVKLGEWASIDPKRNRFRTYYVYLTQDLWGKTCLVKGWGRIGNRPREKFYWPRNDAELARLLQQAIFRRAKRGYVPVWRSPHSSTSTHSPTLPY